MEQTVKHAEKHLGQICSLLASYTRKTASVRDKADLLVTRIFDLSATEGPELQGALKNLAEDLAMVQDYRQAQVERLESRVVFPLKAYGDIVISKRADLKTFSSDLYKEMKEMQKLEKVRQKNPADRQTIAEVSAQKASSSAQRSARHLEETITDFQRQKLEDIKMIFTEFVTVEMLFHAKALEVYTHTHHNLQAADTQSDLKLFSGQIQMCAPLTGAADTLSAPCPPLTPWYPSFSAASMKAPAPRGRLSSASSSAPGRRRPARRFPRTLKRQEELEEEEEEEEEYASETEEDEQGRQSYAA